MTGLVDGLRVWVALGADRTQDPLSWALTDATAYVYLNQSGVGIEIGYPEGSDEAASTKITFLANNTDGRWTPENMRGAWFGLIDRDTPIVVTFDPGTGAVRLGTAYLPDLSPQWEAGGINQTIPIEASGLLTLLEAQDVQRSNAYRTTISLPGLVAYWPCEDGRAALRIASAVAGQPDQLLVPAGVANALAIGGINLAADSDFGGSAPLPTLDSGGTGTVTFAVNPYERPSPETWGAMMALRIAARPAATLDFALIVVCLEGTVRRWTLEISNATPSIIRLKGYNAAGTEVLGDTGISFDSVVSGSSREPFGEQLGVEITARQNGTGIDWAWNLWHPSNSAAGTLGTLASATLGPVRQLATGPSVAMDGATVGHFGAFNRATTNVFEVAVGGLGDSPADRVINQGLAAGIAVVTTPTLTGDPMGAPPVGTDLNVLKECPTLDGGLMWERPDGRLEFRSRLDLVNLPVSMTINYLGQISGLVPTSAVRDYVNRVTVNRTGGSSATVDATGPLSPAGRGVVRSKAIEVNAQTDDHLVYYAQWLANVGTVRESRFTVTLQFHAGAAALLATFLARSLGDRIVIVNPPAWLPPDQIDQYLRGYQLQVSRREFTVTLRLMPSRPYQTWTLEAAGNRGRFDTPGCRTLAAVTSTVTGAVTSAIVGTYGDPTLKVGGKWSTTSLPYDLGFRDAERVTCTAATANPPTFVAAGVATHADNAALTPALPAGLTVGDLLLCVAAIRDSAAAGAQIDDVSGWSRLAVFGAQENVAVFARQYVAGDAAPTITFVSGSAGDTTTAQTCAFRYLQPVLHSRAVRLFNTAAASIATPDFQITRDACVALLVAWKQDDWTSSSPPAGFTEIGEPSSTLGNDQAVTWAYQIQTTATSVAATSFTITGGAAAISKCGGAALLGDVQTLTLTRGVNGVSIAHPAATDVALWRGSVVDRP